MSKKMQAIQAYFKDNLDGAVGVLKSLDSKKSKGNFVYWAEWNAMDYIHWEMVKEYWETLSASLAKLITDGKTEDEIIQWITDCRDQFDRDVLRTGHQHSTNQLGNLIQLERIEVWRRLGSNTMQRGSLGDLVRELSRI